MFLTEWWNKINDYDNTVLKYHRKCNELQDEHEAKEKALDYCERLEAENKVLREENDSLTYEAARRNRARDGEIRELKNRLGKTKSHSDKKLKEELNKLRKENRALRADLEKAQHLELQYNMTTCRWEPVHGSITDIQKYCPLIVATEEK